MPELSPAEAVGDAGVAALVGSRDQREDPELEARERIRRMGAYSPSVGTAAALVSVAATPAIPIDPQDLSPTGNTLRSLEAVADWYSTRPADGVGIALGVNDSCSRFAIRARPSAWAAWLSEHGLVREEYVDPDTGGTKVALHPRPDVGRFALVSWAPPPMGASRVTAATLGRVAGHRAADQLLAATTPAPPSPPLLVWSAARVWSSPPVLGPDGVQPAESQVLVFRDHNIAPHIDLVSTGTVPWHAKRADGWVVASQTMPLPDSTPPPDWFVSLLGGRWKSVRPDGGRTAA